MSEKVLLIDPSTGQPYRAGGGGSSASGPQPASGSQSVTPASDGAAFQVHGNVASSAVDSGNPVKIGGRVATSLGALTNGTRADLIVGAFGNLFTYNAIPTAATDSFANTSIGQQYGPLGQNVVPASAGMYFNPTNLGWDRARGDTNGAYSVSKGASGYATAQVSVGTSATQIVAARANRGSVKITNLGTTDVWLGVAGVSTTTGDLLLGSKGASVTIPTNAAVFGIVGTGSQSVSVAEVY